MEFLVPFVWLLALLAVCGGTVPQQTDILPFGSIQGRIIGGELAKEGYFPYVVGIFVTADPNSNQGGWCGGSLISEEWVLTAGHCTYQKAQATIFLGATRRTEAKQLINSTKFYLHEDFNRDYLWNDISLIKLPIKAILSEHVQLAVLPWIRNTYPGYEGDTVIVPGWGRTSDENSNVSEDLNFIFRQVMTNKDCAFYFGPLLVRVSNICINTVSKPGNQSPCNGDSGGPLVLNDYTRTVIGVTSFGSSRGCDKGYPGVFTRITLFLDWIKSISGVYA